MIDDNYIKALDFARETLRGVDAGVRSRMLANYRERYPGSMVEFQEPGKRKTHYVPPSEIARLRAWLSDYDNVEQALKDIAKFAAINKNKRLAVQRAAAASERIEENIAPPASVTTTPSSPAPEPEKVMVTLNLLGEERQMSPDEIATLFQTMLKDLHDLRAENMRMSDAEHTLRMLDSKKIRLRWDATANRFFLIDEKPANPTPVKTAPAASITERSRQTLDDTPITDPVSLIVANRFLLEISQREALSIMRKRGIKSASGRDLTLAMVNNYRFRARKEILRMKAEQKVAAE